MAVEDVVGDDNRTYIGILPNIYSIIFSGNTQAILIINPDE